MPRLVFSAGELAKLCGVAPRTVCNWFDSGKLRGYRIPGSQDRRIPREYADKFFAENGMRSVEELEKKAAELNTAQ